MAIDHTVKSSMTDGDSNFLFLSYPHSSSLSKKDCRLFFALTKLTTLYSLKKRVTKKKKRKHECKTKNRRRAYKKKGEKKGVIKERVIRKK